MLAAVSLTAMHVPFTTYPVLCMACMHGPSACAIGDVRPENFWDLMEDN